MIALRRLLVTLGAGALIMVTSVSFAIAQKFTAMSAGNFHTCALTAAGSAYCWGAGPLGDGTTTDRLTPVLVAGGVSFATLSTGDSNTCGVTRAGAAYCWGNNDAGQLGDGTTTDRLTPVLVAASVRFTSVSASASGGFHTCGVTDSGAAYCWGNNDAGQLGDGTTTDRLKPVLVAGGMTFKTVAVGFAHTCGVTKSPWTFGTAYCWGNNYDGELGDGTTTDALTPVRVAGGFEAVSAGGLHTCWVRDGTVYCWGNNYDGELGDGTRTDRLIPTSVAGRGPFVAVSAGTYHTCGVTAMAAAYCWGYNGAGAVCDGTTNTPQTIPVPVAGRFQAVSAGGSHHTCGVRDGAVYCCGWGANGQLGNGTTTNQLTPRLVVP